MNKTTTPDEPRSGGGIAITVTDSRAAGEEQDDPSTVESGGEDDSTSEDGDGGFSVTRRDVLVTSAAGYLFAGGTGTVAAADGDQTVEVALNDGIGSNYNRKPSHFELGSATSFTIEPAPELEGKVIDVFIEVKPASLSEDGYETIAQEAIIGSKSTQTIDSEDLENQRDLTQHSKIDLEDFKVDASIAELGTKSNRYVVNSYDLRIRLVDEKGRELAKDTQKFDVTYGLRGGAGVRFGYITGKVAPTSEFRSGSQVR
jgi:hypothetical protein